MWSAVVPFPAQLEDASSVTVPGEAESGSAGEATVDRRDPLVNALVEGKYRVLWPVARGGMARLYEVEHVGLGRRFGLKVIHPHLAEQKTMLARFEREARAAARVASPYVVDVVDRVQVPDGRPAIVTEWLEGEDLEARLARVERGARVAATGDGKRGARVAAIGDGKRGALTAVAGEGERLPLAEALAIAADVCMGLAAAHRAGVIHRDLKPGNVFLIRDESGHVRAKILDFGVAKMEGPAPLTHAGSVLGTPAYMAPEQAQGADEVDARVDVYGVGALLYRMRTGIPPHAPGDPTATLARVLRDEPRRPTDLDPSMPSAVEAVIQRAMARDPALRYPDVEALAAAIDSVRAEVAPAPVTAGRAQVIPHPMTEGHPGHPTELTPGRPTAVAASLALGASTLAVTALTVRAQLGAELSTGEVRVVSLAAFAAGGLVSFTVLSALSRAWPSGPRVGVFRQAALAALTVGLALFGALELAHLGSAALGGELVAGGSATRAGLGLALGAAIYLLRKPRELG